MKSTKRNKKENNPLFCLAIGIAVRGLRKKENLSGKNFSSKVGMTFSKLSRIENGKAVLSFVSACKITEILGLSLEEFLTFVQKIEKALASGEGLVILDIEKIKTKIHNQASEIVS